MAYSRGSVICHQLYAISSLCPCRYHLELSHLPMLGLSVEENRTDSFSVDSGFRRLLEDRVKLSHR